MPDSSRRLEAGLAGRYTIRRELGSGGMATVYLAEDIKNRRPVALKVLRPDLAAALGPERFLRESTLTARLDHPHILPLLDSGEAEGLLYYVMPYVEGESLRDRLNREKQLPLDEALQITREVADALDYAHIRGIVHRDIKPENILLSGGHARLADFGIARAVTEAGEENLTATGIAIGTPAYMSPEQAAGTRDLDGRSDLYSLGCVLYEMLAGEPPHSGASPQVIIAKRLSTPPPRVSLLRDTIPATVESAVSTALARAPADRFPTAARFMEALGPQTEQRPASRGITAGGSRILLGAAFVVTVAALVVSLLVMQPEPGQSEAVRSLAVLPLDNLMGEADQDYFVEGMYDALIAELSRVAGVTMTSRTSAMRYRGTDKSIPEIARELGADGLIEGSVFREGDQVRITVRLIHGASDRHLWSESYQRGLRDVLILQSEVARAIAMQIGVTLTPEQEAQAASVRPVDPEAYTLYLRGNFQAIRRQYPDAIDHYEQAIAIDSSFAPAHAGLAIASIEMALLYTDSTTEFHGLATTARAAAVKALELDSRQAEAHVTLGRLRQLEWDWNGADAAFRRGIDLNPSSTPALLVYHNYLIAMGRFEEAVAISRIMIDRDPLAPYPHNSLAFALLHLGRHPEALEHNRRALELAPDNGELMLLRGELYVLMERFAEALAHAEIAESFGVRDSYRLVNAYRIRLGYIYAKAGRRDNALRVLNQMPTTSSVQIALTHLALDQEQEAWALLERAYEERDPWLSSLQGYYMFDPLRDDPRFQRLLERMDFPR